MSSIKSELLSQRKFVGKVEWIGVAAERRGDLATPDSVEVITDKGIKGEHHTRPHRQVTIIQQEYLPVIAAILGVDSVSPEQLRRNIVVSGINLASLQEREFKIGSVVLRGTGDCAPCALMESTVGVGAYEAMISHGGITTVVVKGGDISIGDPVESIGEQKNSI